MDKLTVWIALVSLAGCMNDPRAGDLASESSESVICAAGPTLEGIDVSYYQGSINWGSVKASGRVFAVARIGDGSFQDPDFAANWSGMKAAGLIRGAYQFFRPGQDAVAQANDVVAKVGMLGDRDLPVTLDMEATDGQSAATIASKIHQWVTRVQAGTGRAPIIYTGKYFWNDSVVTGDFAGNPLWIAAYGPPCPDTPTAWGARPWKIWQYSSSGSVPGIGGNVDLDHFNGTLADLQDLAGGADWGAAYVGQSFPLASSALAMTAGQTVDAWIELRNVGRKPWDSRTRLGTTGPRDRSSPFADASWIGPNRPAGVTGTVAPGATYRFAFKLHAPAQAGNYHEHFGVVEEGVAWFSDAGQAGPPDDQLEAQLQVSAAPVPPPPAPPPVGKPVGVGPTVGQVVPPPAGDGLPGSPAPEPDPAAPGAAAGGCDVGGGSGGTWLVLLLGLALAARRGRRARG